MTTVDLNGMTEAELAEERDFLLKSLDDLEAEHDAGDVDEHDYTVLKVSYTARAAAVLRALDQLVVGPTKPPRVAPVARRRATRGTVAILAVVVIFAGVAGTLVMRTAGQRLPGDNVSGSTPTSPVAKLLAQAQRQFQNQQLLDAVKTYDEVIALDPRNPEALAYKGWLLRLAGHQGNDQALVDRGLQSIRAAEAANPSYPDAHFFVGETLLKDKNDPAGAISEFEQFLADNPPPDYAPVVQGELTAARAQLGAPATSIAPVPPTTAAP